MSKPKQPNPEFAAYGSARMRWIEKDEIGEFRDASEYLRGSRLGRIEGYYCDSFQDETAVPAVYIIDNPTVEPWRGSADSDTHYFAAVRDPVNDGCGVVDFEESYADASEAARAAHSLAERYADVQREFADNEYNKLRLESLSDDVTELRRRHHYLIRALPAIGDDASGARIRSDLRARMTELAKDIRELRSQIRE
jgi:hypothetical protein